MIGKLFGAWLGERIAGRNSGAKGAIIGAGSAALARRALPALVAVAAIGWGVKKLRGRRGAAAYPSDAAPSPPSG